MVALVIINISSMTQFYVDSAHDVSVSVIRYYEKTK